MPEVAGIPRGPAGEPHGAKTGLVLQVFVAGIGVSTAAGACGRTALGMAKGALLAGGEAFHVVDRPAWATLMSAQNGMIQAMFRAAEDGIRAAGGNTRAAHRLTEMRDFYTYMFRELPALIDRWRAQRGG